MRRTKRAAPRSCTCRRRSFPYDRFVRCIGLGPQTRVVNYDPRAPLHDRYRMDRDFISADERAELEDITLTINAFFGWDFNSCEALLKGGVLVPDRFRERVPGFAGHLAALSFPMADQGQPALVASSAPATRRKVRRNLDWEPYFAIAAARPAVRATSCALCRTRAHALRPRTLRGILRAAPGAPRRRSPHEFFGSERRAMPCRRRSPRSFPRTRSISSPSSSSAASSSGAQIEGRAAA